jgi:Holliday junction DNA helicase RuvA
MISFVRGTVVEIGLTACVVDVAAVGYQVYMSGANLAKLTEGAEHTLYTYFVVREDAHDLYGFLEKAERDFFMLLMTVSGVGPKSAMQIIEKALYTRIRQALSQGDLVYLTKMAGIGQKTAQKLILELRDKVGSVTDVDSEDDSDALEALTVLGYSLDDARDALSEIPQTVTGTQHRVKAALKHLGKRT